VGADTHTDVGADTGAGTVADVDTGAGWALRTRERAHFARPKADANVFPPPLAGEG
jgi:hypothetical protein